VAELDVIVNARGAQAGARVAQSALDQIRRTAQGVAAGLYTLERGFSAIWNQTDRAASFEESWQRLNIQTRNYHSTAQLVINDLKAVTNGQLSLSDATQLASRGLAEGLSPDHLRTFATAADALADVMGTDLKQGFDTILQGLATGRTQALANIGVYVDLDKEVKQLAVSTNRTTDQISKQEKAMIAANAVTRQLDTALGKMADDSISEADKLKAIEARFDDITLAVGRFSKALVVDSINALQEFDRAAKGISLQPDFFRRLFGEDRSGSLRKGFSIGPGGIALPPSETPQNIDVWQETLGRSIVADTQGNLARKAQDEQLRQLAAVKAPLDPKLRAIQLGGSADRMRAQIEADSASLIAGSQHQAKLFGLDQQAGQQGVGAGVGAEAFLKAQEDTKLKELAIAGETQNKLLQLETETYQKRIALGFESTQEKFQFEEAYKTKVQSINSEIAKIVQDYANVESESEAEQAVLRGQLQEKLGERIRESLIAEFQLGEDLRHRAQDDAQAYYQNLAKFQEAYGTSRENQMQTEYDMVRANLAKQLDVNQDTAAKVLNAWRNGDSIHAAELLEGTQKTWDQITTIMMGALADQRAVSEKYSDDFFAGFAKGMKKYVDDQSMLGLGVDQARRVAQGMEQAFGKFFFDAMEGRIQSFKDVVQGLVDFSKQILSQLASQLITQSILKGITGAMGGGSVGGLVGGSGDVGGFALRAMGGISAFASGGIATRPMLRWAGGGMNLIGEGQYNEAYVPLPDGRSIPVTIKGMPGYAQPNISVPIAINITNKSDTEVTASQKTGANGLPEIDILIVNTVRKAIGDGKLDQPLGSRFGAKPQPRRA
jgi:hypothetical protein